MGQTGVITSSRKHCYSMSVAKTVILNDLNKTSMCYKTTRNNNYFFYLFALECFPACSGEIIQDNTRHAFNPLIALTKLTKPSPFTVSKNT